MTAMDTMRILVADDDPVVCRYLEAILSKEKYMVTVVSNGTDALNELLGDTPPDIAILDWHMPGQTGIQVSIQHHASDKKILTYKIILSGTVEKEQILEALHSGAHDVLLKPIDIDLL